MHRLVCIFFNYCIWNIYNLQQFTDIVCMMLCRHPALDSSMTLQPRYQWVCVNCVAWYRRQARQLPRSSLSDLRVNKSAVWCRQYRHPVLDSSMTLQPRYQWVYVNCVAWYRHQPRHLPRASLLICLLTILLCDAANTDILYFTPQWLQTCHRTVVVYDISISTIPHQRRSAIQLTCGQPMNFQRASHPKYGEFALYLLTNFYHAYVSNVMPASQSRKMTENGVNNFCICKMCRWYFLGKTCFLSTIISIFCLFLDCGCGLLICSLLFPWPLFVRKHLPRGLKVLHWDSHSNGKVPFGWILDR